MCSRSANIISIRRAACRQSRITVSLTNSLQFHDAVPGPASNTRILPGEHVPQQVAKVLTHDGLQHRQHQKLFWNSQGQLAEAPRSLLKLWASAGCVGSDMHDRTALSGRVCVCVRVCRRVYVCSFFLEWVLSDVPVPKRKRDSQMTNSPHQNGPAGPGRADKAFLTPFKFLEGRSDNVCPKPGKAANYRHHLVRLPKLKTPTLAYRAQPCNPASPRSLAQPAHFSPLPSPGCSFTGAFHSIIRISRVTCRNLPGTSGPGQFSFQNV